ncbi:MAG: RNA methyltransferase [Candidatus Omnitrophota bacterium]
MAKQGMFLYGKNSVYERLKVNSATIKKIILETGFRAPHIETLIKKHGIPTERISLSRMERLKRAKNIQGILAEVEPFKYAALTELLKQDLTFIFLDRINDPQNLGVIIRSLACFGNFAVIIPEKGACSVTEAVLHVASGADNYIPVAVAGDMGEALKQAKDAGFNVYAATPQPEALDINKISFPFPLVLILGSEAQGISPVLEKHIDYKIRIPMYGAQLSLNVSMACTVFCHEICRQKKLLR